MKRGKSPQVPQHPRAAFYVNSTIPAPRLKSRRLTNSFPKLTTSSSKFTYTPNRTVKVSSSFPANKKPWTSSSRSLNQTNSLISLKTSSIRKKWSKLIKSHSSTKSTYKTTFTCAPFKITITLSNTSFNQTFKMIFFSMLHYKNEKSKRNNKDTTPSWMK